MAVNATKPQKCASCGEDLDEGAKLVLDRFRAVGLPRKNGKSRLHEALEYTRWRFEFALIEIEGGEAREETE